MNSTKKLAELKTNRNIVRVVVVVGILASIAANTLGAASWINAAIAGWPPVALLLALEILTRVPTSKRWGAAGRILATLGVAGAAGWLSYWHMAATVSQHGEHGGSEYVWPVSVDGLMTIAAIALVELGARIRQIESAASEAAPAALPQRAAPPVMPAPARVMPAAPVLLPRPVYVPPVVTPVPPVVRVAPVPVATPVVAEAEAIVRQAARLDPVAAVAEMRTNPYWGQRIGGSRRPVRKA